MKNRYKENMGCNLKVAAIVVATLTITFSSLTLVKLSCSAFNQYKEKQQIDNGGLPAPRHEPLALETTTAVPPKTPEKASASRRYKEVVEKWSNRPTTYVERVVGILVTIMSIVTSFMVFNAVSDDYDYNARKRHMILPFVVFHSLINFFHAVAILYIAITYREYMDVLLVPVLIYIAMVFVTVIGISFVGAYHKALARMAKSAGFGYAQMEDIQKEPIDEEKKPLA